MVAACVVSLLLFLLLCSVFAVAAAIVSEVELLSEESLNDVFYVYVAVAAAAVAAAAIAAAAVVAAAVAVAAAAVAAAAVAAAAVAAVAVVVVAAAVSAAAVSAAAAAVAADAVVAADAMAQMNKEKELSCCVRKDLTTYSTTSPTMTPVTPRPKSVPEVFITSCRL